LIRLFGSICKTHERKTWTILTTASSSFRYEKGYGDHEEAEGIPICGMTVVIGLYDRLQFVYRLVSIVVAAPIVYTAVLFRRQTFSRRLCWAKAVVVTEHASWDSDVQAE
jgi:hypothetical protein